ncbi:WecB/TagA/CpsF family glycosyltransferase [Candidatus Daviesbacteria bacterium]|nr:WecB/TagA/CpsF family glycosyltransferase [Candidatus Daviesbacteria bacterium]
MNNLKPKSISIFSVKVDEISMNETLEKISEWVKGDKKRYIVTTNIEFIMAAQKDRNFRNILNNSDLSIPDSSRIGWAKKVLEEKNLFKKLFFWLFFFYPKLVISDNFPLVTGTDLMLAIAEKSNVWPLGIGLIGGRKTVAKRASECLQQRYQNISINYSLDGGKVDKNGQMEKDYLEDLKTQKVDILFVGLGHIKQEKWIIKNIDKVPAKVFIGVGGAFDYISENIPRAPKLIRELNFEWLFRLIIQPWRIKRFISLLEFMFLLLQKPNID